MRTLIVALGLLPALACLAAVAGLAETSCVACHANPDWFEAADLEIARRYQEDVHSEIGLSCHDCHGGNPSPELADDPEAMDPEWGENPFVGVPARPDIPASCGSCHSDPSYMKTFRPDARIDQEQEYWTSQHGEALRAGDANVATCTDCHGVHGIRRAADPEADVYPTRVATMCGRCHADSDRMRGYLDSHGRPLAVTQLALWQRSVHAASMLEKGDLTAPTCNDCHGNHGAAPPGLESVSFVCGQCHGRAADLFRTSVKHEAFALHNEYLAEAEGEGCAACHESPQSEVDLVSFSECATCHGNHGVVRPTIAMFSGLPQTPCEFCHDADATQGEPSSSVARHIAKRAELLTEAASLDLEGQELFDWFIDRTTSLAEHSLTAGDDTETVLRPEFAELFRRFRLGKSFTTYADPVSGEERKAPVVRCEDCHSESEDSAGAAAMLEANRTLMLATARAERVLLAARRGGVEVGEVLAEVEQAIDAEIGLAALVHTFDAEDGSAFAETHAEGLDAAASALAKGRDALDELAFRRRGLGVSLVIILALLVALGLKIRSLPG